VVTLLGDKIPPWIPNQLLSLHAKPVLVVCSLDDANSALVLGKHFRLLNLEGSVRCGRGAFQLQTKSLAQHELR